MTTTPKTTHSKGAFHIYYSHGMDDALHKMCFYFTLEFRTCLELSMVSVAILKLTPAECASNAVNSK